MILLILILWCTHLFLKEAGETINEIRGAIGKEAREHEAEIVAEEILNDPTTQIIKIGEARILTFMIDGYQEVIILNQPLTGSGQDYFPVRSALKLHKLFNGQNNTKRIEPKSCAIQIVRYARAYYAMNYAPRRDKNNLKPALELLIKTVERRFVYLY